MSSFFQHTFIINALIAGMILSFTCAILGHFLVANRQAILSDMLAHTALAGVGLGVYLNLSPTLMANIVVVISAAILWTLMQKLKVVPEAISMMLLTGGLAIALVFVHLAPNNPISFESFLFGSILTLSSADVYQVSIFSILVLITLFLGWNRFLGLSIHQDTMKAQFKNTWLWELVFMIMIAIMVSVSLKVIGGLLVSALLIIPSLITSFWSKSFLASSLKSSIISSLSTALGIYISFLIDVPTSSSIVLTLIAVFLISALLKSLKNHYELRKIKK